MQYSERSLWTLLEKHFIRLAGGDYFLVMRADAALARKYAIAGMLMLGLLLLSLTSVFYGMDLLFHNWPAELGLSFFIACLFCFIYVFLMTTFTRRAAGGYLTASNIVRIFFVVFIAVLVSKPLEIWLFNARVEESVAERKVFILKEHRNGAYKLYQHDLQALEYKRDRILAKPYYENEELVLVNEALDHISAKLKESEVLLIRRLEQTSLLIYRIQTVSRYPVAWLFTLVIIAVFLLPGFLVYTVANDSRYFESKYRKERQLVKDEYAIFLLEYKKILGKWDAAISHYSVYIDPPFNTQRKKQPGYGAQEAFFEKYLR
ncbi:DUF4407 domain-containing protein [Nostoc ellipsosporum NOK]|nr:DUF4407 domain-containing protein [Nostoc ellipsosporum NOK]